MNLDRTPFVINDSGLSESSLKEIFQATDCSQFLSPEESEFIARHSRCKVAKKGTLLLIEGQIAHTCYYLIQGCVRDYYLLNGEEKTIEFYLAGDSISDDLSKRNREPSTHNWECVTDCIFSFLPGNLEQEMYSRFPGIESLCRIETEKQFSRYRESVRLYLASTPEERYDHLIRTRPELLSLVPQYQIASYIGVKPESLSRIRSRRQLL